jgi:hypothetical protein
VSERDARSETDRAPPQVLAAWLLVGLAVLASVLLIGVRGSGPRPGDRVRERISLVPQDRARLACSLVEDFQELACAYAGEPPDPVPRSESTLQPFVTVDRKLYLLAGLFHQPSLQTQDLPAERFTVSCDLRLVGKAPPPIRIRWKPRGAWQAEGATWVAVPERCWI